MNELVQLRQTLAALGSPDKAQAAARFFKVGPGQYAEGDVFIGVTSPEVRRVVKVYRDLPLGDVKVLLMSPVHEERLCALPIMVSQYFRGNEMVCQAIYESYLSHTRWINNWDLVDISAEFIVGPWLQDKDKTILVEMAGSPLLWERRIAMLATFHYIRQGDPDFTLKIAELLIHDPEDLIQKAVGWMLREIGKRCSTEILEEFLSLHYQTMPRTMLRYAIERFSPEVRREYLKGLI
jgi:hypothetical protein